MDKPIIYQLLPRLWGNMENEPQKNGNLQTNGTGKFSAIDKKTLSYLKWLGVSHVWYTGVIRHATTESSGGCEASDSSWVKGKAGSPYAINDYYDVNPYLADDPENRMREFDDLVKRTHESGLKVILDFVPNHVARDYGRFGGRNILGKDDDRNVHWKAENDFFYYPGQTLELPSGKTSYCECPAKASGNNYSSKPGIYDWYDTIKLNYCNFHTQTWDKMYEIVRFWAAKGIDGFRCDMVELVPQEFFEWMIAKIKNEFNGVIFIAEVYQKQKYADYIYKTGFDYLYDKSGMYDTLRSIVSKNLNDKGMPVELWQSAKSITWNWQSAGTLQPHMLNFLENHDEQRFASDFFGKKAGNTFAALYVSLFLNTSPFMIYSGEEAGERGMDEEGMSGLDGRTSIYDWWSVSSLKKLYRLIHNVPAGYINADMTEIEHITGMDKEDQLFFSKFASAIRLAASEPAVTKGCFYDLCYCNYSSDGFDENRHFAFLRHYGSKTLLVFSNFSNVKADTSIIIPEDAFGYMKIKETPEFNSQSAIRVVAGPMDAEIIELEN
ncbi:MAG: alpha-amylase family glycosyl hydrolase [Bacteroidales bacterium]|jgi:glycosidase|nr:alpha-amylase family glycosyl hydrolase [Bacteroidales bacterium]MCI1786032.1 alpha-amylase family glycosyl hydrolase [Bacteroidales bacterium]